MFEKIERIAAALEAIVRVLEEINDCQKNYISLVERETSKQPQNIMTIFDEVRSLMGGKHGQ
jgi:hypothetical protein